MEKIKKDTCYATHRAERLAYAAGRREKSRLYAWAYYGANREKRLAYFRKHCWKNPEVERVRVHEWYMTHHAYALACARFNYARKKKKSLLPEGSTTKGKK